MEVMMTTRVVSVILGTNYENTYMGGLLEWEDDIGKILMNGVFGVQHSMATLVKHDSNHLPMECLEEFEMDFTLREVETRTQF
jgi:hypothetical protein